MILRKDLLSSLVVCFVVCNLFVFAPQENGPGAKAHRTAAPSNAGWVKFQDPFERVRKAGWGGLFRLGYSDYQPMVDLKSSDGKTNIRFGDVAIAS